ncbi:MAG: CPBP family intramembrane metalloprotease [Cyanobacteria bacterium CRU_2_1]|nr:CPBP family intramembrane metalloprotease [Cyanobacteria bacterium RU_5_0]NJR63416.1 CPBP family intramembrane metalloprotease [Cyanobacteria bacterium CRU_2_1]
MRFEPAYLLRYAAPVRLLVFVFVLLIFWLPIAAPIALLVQDSNIVTIITMSLLFVEFLILVSFWGWWVHHDSHILQTYGLILTRQNGIELLTGLSLSSLSLIALFGIQGWLGWITWQPASGSLIRIVLEGSLTALGTSFAEELVFRGWILDELQRDYNPRVILWIDSLIFACLHFLKPLPDMLRTFPQFPGLVLLGLALVWAKRSTYHKQRFANKLILKPGRLGLPMGIHAGLIWSYYILNVGGLIQYRDRVPEWITGIDQNPLSGAVGLSFLLGLAWLMWKRSHSLIH